MSEEQKKYPNLINNSELTPEKRKKMASNGGKKSVKIKKEKKLFKEFAQAVLDSLTDEGLTVQEAGLKAIAKRFIEDGDVQAGAFLRDSSGQKPKEDIAVVNMPIINIKGL